MVTAKSAGGFLGGIFNNPGVIILTGLAILLLFFQKDIRGAFGSLGEGISQGIGGLGNIDITLPEFNFPDIKFPDITFPSFDFGGFFEGFNPFPDAVLTPEGDVAVIPLNPPGSAINPADDPTNPTPVDIILSEGGTVEQPIDPTDPNQDPTKFLPPSQDIPQTPVPSGPDLFLPAGTNIGPFLGLDQPSFIGPPEPEPTSQLNIGQEQPFTLAPLGAQTLSSIIGIFDVTASQAANIKFISQQGGDPFATPENIFGENPPAVSDPQFQNLTPEQIFLQLVGGNISNF